MTPTRPTDKLAFVSSETDEANAAREQLIDAYGAVPLEQADAVVALGGDGLMLQCLHRLMNTDVPIYGMNRGSVGFLMNEFGAEDLRARIAAAEIATVHPLAMHVATDDGPSGDAFALNEVSLLRQSFQAAKLRIAVDGRTRLDEMICDGVLVATPAGSTAYNLSAHGPIIPINAPLLALTPISPFRPRRWRGALLPNKARIDIDVLEPEKRPVSAVADHTEFRNVVSVSIREEPTHSADMLFDPGHSLDERIIAEQFGY